MTEPLYHQDAYLQEAEATVTAVSEDGAITLDTSVFYPTSGGQPGDSGWLRWGGHAIRIVNTAKGEGGASVLIPEDISAVPAVGTHLTHRIDWDRRYAHMRMHTALHFLSVVIPLPVTGGQIGAEKGRLDFMMPEPPEDRDALEAALNELVDRNLTVTQDWITEAELDANPSLVKTMSVQPPRGAGRIRLVRIGEGDAQVDLQPCGGTHVSRTGAIGTLRLGKIENKGKQNRRVNIHFA